MTDLNVNLGEGIPEVQMHAVECNHQRMFVSGRLWRWKDRDTKEIHERFEPAPMALTDGTTAVLVAWKYGPVPRLR